MAFYGAVEAAAKPAATPPMPSKIPKYAGDCGAAIRAETSSAVQKCITVGVPHPRISLMLAACPVSRRP
jgi:hypothetical protein